MNAAERGVYIDKLIFNLWRNFLGKYAHLNSCPSIDFHFDFFSEFKFIKKLPKIVVICLSMDIISNKLVDMNLFRWFLAFLKVLFILFFFSLIFFVEWGSVGLLGMVMATSWFLPLSSLIWSMENWHVFQDILFSGFSKTIMTEYPVEKSIIDLYFSIFKYFPIFFSFLLNFGHFVSIVSQQASQFFYLLKLFIIPSFNKLFSIKVNFRFDSSFH